MVIRHKIKHRTLKWDNLPTGYYIYSRGMPDCLNGRKGFRRERIEGPIMSKPNAEVRAMFLFMSYDELVKFRRGNR